MKVYSAIRQVMAAMSAAGISKGRRNQAQGYSFRGIDDVLNGLSGPLTDAGLSILPRCTERVVTERATKNGGALFSVVVKVEFDLIAAEDGSHHTVTTYGEAMDSADKATNKAMSAAFKYMAILAFCIPTESTPDADFETHEVKAITAVAEEPASTELDRETREAAITAIKSASSLRDLREHFEAAYIMATEAGDAESLAAFIAAKDARKLSLDAAASMTAAAVAKSKGVRA
jgi:hypothetical protein